MDDIVNEFLVESLEGLDQIDRDLVALEHAPADRELLARVFRCVHTIKGTCGFLGFARLESVAHAGESLLARLRDGTLCVTPEITSALLALVDAIRSILASIEHDRSEGDADFAPLTARLTALYAMGDASQGTLEPVAHEGPGPVIQHEEAGSAAAFRRESAAPWTEPPVPPMATDADDATVETRSIVTDSSIRVDVGLLDRLMNIVGELVLARNQILQHAALQPGSPLTVTAQRLNLLTAELQEGVMKTRMQPIGNVWSKFPRIVRDLAVACDKQIRLDMDGRETELDRTIIEAIKDPLTHIIRNAADHGIEPPSIRQTCGKSPEGRLSLRAYHEGGQVVIEIADDGAGIDVERLKRTAVEKGIVGAEHAARMGEREALNLIFAAGLSTAARVTNISGRGVGMDVVKSNIEKIGGAVDIQSTPAQGTTLKIKIPLTLAIIPALIVSSGGQRYAIPQVNLLELVRREGRETDQVVERMHDAPVYRLRGNLLPLVHLREALRVETQPSGGDDALNIVVLQADDRTFGLVVDEINDTEEIVVKPLDKQLKGITEFAGATIMGDGRVALILDVMGLAQRARVVSEVRERSRLEQVVPVRAMQGDRQTLLVCGLDDVRRVAIPLSSVARLEEFPSESVERAGDYQVVQYRNRILPLLDLAGLVGGVSNESSHEVVRVVVYRDGERSIGLTVGRILDIVEEDLVLDRTSARAGVLGAVVVQQRVTDVLDIEAIVRDAGPYLHTDPTKLEEAA